MGKSESDFVHDVFKPALEAKFPDCMIIKQDPNVSFQGIPDLLMLYGDKWACFETKKGKSAAKQLNQPYYVEKMNDMSFCAFVNPENMLEVLDGVSTAFGVEG